jgi:hypothetical protein
MTIDVYGQIINLFRVAPGVTVRDADSIIATETYLQRNPGLSFVAMAGSTIVPQIKTPKGSVIIMPGCKSAVEGLYLKKNSNPLNKLIIF